MIEIMQEGTFFFNGRHSEEIGCFIRERPKKVKGKRIVEMKDVFGKNRLSVIDKGYYTNSLLSLSCFCLLQSYDDLFITENEAAYFFDTKGTYVDFIPYYDPNYVYQVINNSELTFEGKRATKLAIPFSFDLSVAPFKFRSDGLNPQVFDKPFKIINSERYPSEPYIKIIGSGDIKLYINEKEFQFKNVDSFIEIDSDQEVMEAYKEIDGVVINQNEKMYSDNFPILIPGVNEFSWSGSIEKIIMKGRWKTRA